MNSELELLRAALRFQGVPDAQAIPLPLQLPQQIPAPFPSHWPEVLGTLESAPTGNPDNPFAEGYYAAQLYFAPQMPEQENEFLRVRNAELLSLGWQPPERLAYFHKPQGFQDSHFPMPRAQDIVLPNPLTELRYETIRANWNRREDNRRISLMLNIQAASPLYFQVLEEPVLPVLSAPEGWNSHFLGQHRHGGRGVQYAQSLARLTGTGKVSKLHEKYAEQLRQAGWQLLSQAQADDLWVSRWRIDMFTQGLLTLSMDMEEPEVWQAERSATRQRSNEDAHGSQSYFSF